MNFEKTDSQKKLFKERDKKEKQTNKLFHKFKANCYSLGTFNYIKGLTEYTRNV